MITGVLPVHLDVVRLLLHVLAATSWVGGQLVLAAHWADLHGEDSLGPRTGAGGRVLPGRERAVRLGGDGTPRVAEFSVMELGALQGLGVVAARILLADALNLRHRHPVLWRLVCEAKVWGWAARKVARRCAAVDLSLEQARWVDGQVADYVATLPWGQVADLVEAKIIEADPAAAAARARAAHVRASTGSAPRAGRGRAAAVSRDAPRSTRHVSHTSRTNAIAAITQVA